MYKSQSHCVLLDRNVLRGDNAMRPCVSSEKQQTNNDDAMFFAMDDDFELDQDECDWVSDHQLSEDLCDRRDNSEDAIRVETHHLQTHSPRSTFDFLDSLVNPPLPRRSAGHALYVSFHETTRVREYYLVMAEGERNGRYIPDSIESNIESVAMGWNYDETCDELHGDKWTATTIEPLTARELQERRRSVLRWGNRDQDWR